MRLPRFVAAPLASTALRALGMWRPPPQGVPPEALPALEQLAARVDAGTNELLAPPPGVSALDLLRYLADERAVLFHGTPRGDLTELAPIRQSRDTSEFGDQQAVYATSDPIWAMFFAVLDRSNPKFGGTRNGTMTVVGRRRSFGPRYFFGVNAAAFAEPLWRPGTVYVVPRSGFVAEEREFGVIDNAHYICTRAVSALAKVAVEPGDFPFKDHTFGFPIRESNLRTLRRVRAQRHKSRST